MYCYSLYSHKANKNKKYEFSTHSKGDFELKPGFKGFL